MQSFVRINLFLPFFNVLCKELKETSKVSFSFHYSLGFKHSGEMSK